MGVGCIETLSGKPNQIHQTKENTTPLDTLVMLPTCDSAVTCPHTNLASICGVYFKDQQAEGSLIGPVILVQPIDCLAAHL